jgi:HEAT repeat protein
MSLTLEAVLEELEADEPDYKALAARFGAEALGFLEQLARGPDPAIAPKAVYLAALIPDPGAVKILERAARSQDRRWRVAAAAAAADLSAADANGIVGLLIGDTDPGVRRTAIISTPLQPSAAVERALRTAAATDDVPYVRNKARDVLARVDQGRK